MRRGRDATVDRLLFRGFSGYCFVTVRSYRVALEIRAVYFRNRILGPTEQRDFEQIHMVQMVLFCPLFEGSGAGKRGSPPRLPHE